MLTHKPFDNLHKIVQKKKINVRYPKGYKHWKARFDTTLRETRGDVRKALEKIHGKDSKQSAG